MSNARVLVAGQSHVGMKRTHNEDSFAVAADGNLFMVADGMGGHSSGEVASKLAIETIQEFIQSTDLDPEATWPYKMDKSRSYEENRLITSVKLANLRIYESAQRDVKMRGMGTTIVASLVVDEGILAVHVGDSRMYRLRGDTLEQLTEDHSLLNDYIKMKRLTEEEIANFQYKNVIVRALGMKETVKVDSILDIPKADDIYCLCSDGLSGPVTDAEIKEVLTSAKDLESACDELIQRANKNGGPDNITVVLAKWLGKS